jgi:RNA polymerase sigma factor (sigma-70 family)
MTDAELSAFAYAIARKMLRAGHVPAAVQIEDIAQAGLVSALEARKRYDGEAGASFRTFVGHRIRGAIRDEIHRQMRSHAETNCDDLERLHHTETPERYAMQRSQMEHLARAFERSN